MKIPIAVWFGALGVAFPLACAIVLHRRQSRPRILLAVWMVFFLADSVASYWWAKTRGNNLIFAYLSEPVDTLLLVIALSMWLTRPALRRAWRVSLPLVLAVMAFVVFRVEKLNDYSTIATPLYSLYILATALTVLVSRSAESTESITDKDWFWLSLGLALFYAALAPLSPVAQYVLRDRPDIVRKMWEARSWISVLAYLLMARGMACPKSQETSGPSISASPSPSG